MLSKDLLTTKIEDLVKKIMTIAVLVSMSSTVFASNIECSMISKSKEAKRSQQYKIGILEYDDAQISKTQDGFEVTIIRDGENLVEAEVTLLDSGFVFHTGAVSIDPKKNVSGMVFNGYDSKIENGQAINVFCKDMASTKESKSEVSNTNRMSACG